jgi:ParB family transcriptional regulator, chromosome partitioning protein
MGFLLPTKHEDPRKMNAVQSTSDRLLVRLDHIHPNPDNPRTEAGDVTELANSIRQHGIKQDIVVRVSQEHGIGHFVIEDGYRRWVAAKTVLEQVYVKVERPQPHENLAIREVITSLVTDLHRQDLTPIERAKAYGRLRDEAGMNQAQIAKKMGLRSDSSVSRSLALLELSPGYQKAVAEGKASVERALEAVGRQRAKDRQKKGQKPAKVEWEPEHFTKDHPLAKKARTMCDAREHTGRRRYGGVACGNCWETVIRQDENLTVRVEYKGLGFDVPFIPPIMTPDNENGKAAKG